MARLVSGAPAETLLIFLVFLVHAAWPVPEVNETHYLAKAKHYWNPTWCEGDFFLDTADAHQVFYWTFGWLTIPLALPAVAWMGRLLAWGLLAWSWRRLSFAVIPRPLVSVLTAAVFVWLIARYHLAGEWVVGGVEAKGFAYALVFLGLEALVRSRWNRAWLLLGGASALHVLVGGWSVLAAVVAWLFAGEARPRFRSMLPGLAGGFLLSLLGLVPALLLSVGVEPEITAQANRIYVFERLPHHLALHTLDTEELYARLLRNGSMLGCFLLLLGIVPGTGKLRRVQTFVLATVGFALVGLGLCYGLQQHETLQAALLRYYWFRLYDVALPLGLAMMLGSLFVTLQEKESLLVVPLLVLGLAFPAWHLGSVLLARLETHMPPADRKMRDPADWIEACRWVREETPADAHFLTPRMNQTFKWRTGRSEVVTHKDIPQDARGIVAWWKRMNDVYPLYRREGRLVRHSPAWLDAAELLEAVERYQVDYILTQSSRPLDGQHFRLRFQNNTLRLYEAPPRTPAPQPAAAKTPDSSPMP